MHRLALLKEATDGLTRAAQKLITLGHTPTPQASEGSLSNFNVCVARRRTELLTLARMGFRDAADSISADELSTRIGEAGPERIGTLIAQLRAASFATFSGASPNETVQLRAERAQKVFAQLEALGFGDEARALMPSTTPQTSAPVQAPAGFLNLGA